MLHTGGIPILCYHSIDTSNSPVSVTPTAFARQMDWLRKRGFNSLTLNDLVGWVQAKGGCSGKPVCLVFDDGYYNNYTHGFPILQEVGFTATIFVATDYCARINSWDNQHRSIPRLRMMSWENIVEMSRHGIEFGSHTRSHPDLTQLGSDEVREELIGAKKVLQDRIGKAVRFCSYPFGKFNTLTKQVARSAFSGAVSNRIGKVTPESDRYALERINAASALFKILPTRVVFAANFDFYIAAKKSVDSFKHTYFTRYRQLTSAGSS